VFEACNRLSLSHIVFGFVFFEIVEGEISPIFTVPSNSVPFFFSFLFLTVSFHFPILTALFQRRSFIVSDFPSNLRFEATSLDTYIWFPRS
jgi:hypothetical protein